MLASSLLLFIKSKAKDGSEETRMGERKEQLEICSVDLARCP